MIFVRWFLAFALVLHFSGVPAVVASPCASSSAGAGHECCIRHQTESGGDVIGHCGCGVNSDPQESPSATSVAAPSSERAHGADAAVVDLPSHANRPQTHHSLEHPRFLAGALAPPLLSSTGFRC
jgi:hypothetical protein